MRYTRVIILVFSLAANGALAIAIWPHLNDRPVHGGLEKPGTANIPPSETHSDSARWQEISDIANDTDLITRLRAEGFPPETVRALVTQRVYARLKPRLDALKQKAPPPKPYWQNGGWWSAYNLDPATRAEQRALWREAEDTVKALFGSDSEPQSAYQREQRARSFGPIPSEKISEIEAISRDYDEMIESINDNAKGVMLASDRQKLAYLEKEKRADLARLLAPEELEEYDRRNSSSAEETRNKLKFFDGTEDDFLKLFALQREFDDRYGHDNLSGEAKDRRKAALPELDRQIEAMLGPERYAQFQIVNDVNFSATRATLERVGLPQEKAPDLVVIQRDAKKRAEIIRNDRSLTTSQRDEQLAALQKEATRKASTILGSEENLDMFKRTAGQWLGKLVSRANPDPK
ncbi:MAG: hypothetical protein QM760_16615 [Nibricoccus sp.]